MTEAVDVERRRFLLAAVGLAASAAIAPAVLARLLRDAAREADAFESVQALITHRSAAAHLGRVYLDSHGRERGIGVLLRLLGSSRPESVGQARRRISDGIRADFRANRTVSVDGWILSRTEARLYALVALA